MDRAKEMLKRLEKMDRQHKRMIEALKELYSHKPGNDLCLCDQCSKKRHDKGK